MWIEIKKYILYLQITPVTPFAGVWIEIAFHGQGQSSFPSLPSRECGLKYPQKKIPYRYLKSLPSRECGLKLFCRFRVFLKVWSLPSRECGLKYKEGVSMDLQITGHSLRGSVD